MQETLLPSQPHPVKFEGKGMEYFRIWIVNIALTILTLGIYSAWAKVRNKQYFYGSTSIKSQSFLYHATGWQILKGRLIAVVAFVIFSFIPVLNILLPLLMIFAAPWLVNSGLRFNARMSSWRNVHFNFEGSYGRAFMVLFVWPLLAILTLGILAPKAVYKLANYIVTSHKYGDEPFNFSATDKVYGRVIYGAMILALVVIVAIAITVSASSTSIYAPMVLPALIGVAYIGFFFGSIAVNVLLFNIYWNHVQLQGNGFKAYMSPAKFIWVFISNSIAVGLSLGLLLPWSKVRMARLKASALTMIEVTSLDQIQAEQQEKSNAIGEELGEVFDVDVGFGV